MYTQVIDSLGLSQTALESIVIYGIIGVVFVLYWRFIIMGAMALLCISVLANHKTPESVPSPTPAAIMQPEEKQQKPETKEEQIEEKGMFMEDCLHLTDYTEKKCEDIWYKRDKAEVPEELSET